MNSKPKKKLKYNVLTDIEHVLKRPDTYGGSVTEETWKVNINGVVHNSTIVPMLLRSTTKHWSMQQTTTQGKLVRRPLKSRSHKKVAHSV